MNRILGLNDALLAAAHARDISLSLIPRFSIVQNIRSIANISHTESWEAAKQIMMERKLETERETRFNSRFKIIIALLHGNNQKLS